MRILSPLFFSASRTGMAGGIVFLCLHLVGCTENRRGAAISRAQQGQTLRVYNFPNYLGHTTLSSFEEKTGSKVVVETYASNEELIRTLSGDAPYDVVFPSSYAVERLIQQGRLRTMERERVPNLIQVPERFRNPPVDPNLRHCVPYTWSMTGIGILSPRDNPGHDPDSLSVLFAERGPKVAMLDDMRATLGVALRYLGLSASTRSPADLARARDLLLAQSPRVLSYVSDAGPTLSKGQAPLSLAWSGDVLQAATHNPEVRFVLPREGTLLYVDYACVPEGAKDPALAFAFLNHLLEPQVAAEITNSQLFATPNLGAERMLQPEARWLLGILDAVKDQGRFEMIRDVGPAMPAYEDAWRAVKERIAARR